MTDRHIDADTRDTTTPAPLGGYDRDAGFDDGLVHDHGWACRERGAPAT